MLLEITGDPPVMAELDRMLGLADDVIRHKVIRLPEDGPGRSSRSAVPRRDTAEAGGTNGAQ